MAIRKGGYEFDTLEEAQKAIELGMVQKHDVVEASPHIQPAHGLWHDANLGGLFSDAGAERDVYHTVVRPETTFLSRLVAAGFANQIRNPEYDILSGVRDITGDPAVDACSDAPIIGEAKLCTLTSRFGQLNVRWRQADVSQMDGRINRADVDRNLVNNFLFGSAFLPDVINQANINSTTGLALFRSAIQIERDMMWALFNGTEGNASRTFTNEFDGFDNVLVADPTDIRGNVCTAASSTIVDWSDNDLTATVNGADIVQTLGGVLHRLTRLAATTSMSAQWLIAMDHDMFYRLTEIWPCSYLTDGCAVQSTSQPLNIDSAKQIAMRDEMRNGNFLWILGRRFTVLAIDGDTIGRTAVGPGYSSDIYIIPLTAMGRNVTNIEWFGLGGPDAQAMTSLGGPSGSNIRFTNRGMYMITKLETHACVEWKFHMQPRLICRTPWLGARITNVNYNLPDFAWSISAVPGTEYYRDGGEYWVTPN